MITPFRSDFVATEATTIAWKEAIYWRRLASMVSDAAPRRAFRSEMRRYAMEAVALARRYRASRT